MFYRYKYNIRLRIYLQYIGFIYNFKTILLTTLKANVIKATNYYIGLYTKGEF